METRNLSPEGVAILEAMMEGAGSPLLSKSVLQALEHTGLIEQAGEGWLITEEGLRSLEAAKKRFRTEPPISHGIG